MTFIAEELRLLSPTGLGIRSDRQGSGYYRAKRGTRLHKGVDYIARPGQEIASPMYGRVVRVAYPYKDRSYSGLVIENEFLTIKLFYLDPMEHLIGQQVRQGELIGYAQDISKRYAPGMVPHVHLEIVSIDPNIFVRE